MAKPTRITYETDSLLIVQSRNLPRGWCPVCEAEGEMITLENAGVISNLDRAELEQWLNSSELHRSLGADGSAQVCLKSLLARLQSGQS